MDIPPDDLQNVPAASAGTGERRAMSAALMWLLDGIAKIPATEARVSDLTLDSRQVRAGSLFFALPGTQRARTSICGRCRRARRKRGVVGTLAPMWRRRACRPACSAPPYRI